MKQGWLLAVVVGLGLAGCPQPPTTNPLTGTWRSHFAQITLSAQGGSIQFGCATGTIDAPVIVNAQGEFSVDGTYTQGSGVAPPPGTPPPTPQPTVYSGQVSGNTLSFRFQIKGGSISSLITLVRDGPDQVVFCP